MLFFVLAAAGGYLLGSLPGGYIVGKGIGGVDVRKFGSGNIGATNVLRVLGKGPALLVLLIDLGKGAAAVYLAGLFPTELDPSLLRAIAGLACISGHNWSFFLKLKGGKGVATSAGVFLLLTPLPFIFALLTMSLVVGITRYVSLGSMTSAVALPLYIWILMGEEGLSYIVLGAVVAALIIFRHRSNLKRLLAGQENKLGQPLSRL
jgi:glycerol-3-phosphate acyltransferase PlsY